MKNISSIDGTEIEKRIELLQNCPNPFRTATEIRCTLPEEIKTAFICVFDLNGRQKQRFDLKERGETSITIDGNTLEPGMYIYTLVADGVEIDSKRMILTE